MTKVIAIDGPTASGKGTLARRLAAHFGFAYLDTGGLYRATALRLLRAGASPDTVAGNIDGAVAAASGIRPADLTDPDLRAEATGNMASAVAALQPVRDALFDYQQRFAAAPPDGAAGAVLDGRDIGTVICPQADVKLFVTASDTARATRRFRELQEKGQPADFDTVLRDLQARDARDSGRTSAPLKPADDAVLLDTTELDIEAAFSAAREEVAARLR